MRKCLGWEVVSLDDGFIDLGIYIYRSMDGTGGRTPSCTRSCNQVVGSSPGGIGELIW